MQQCRCDNSSSGVAGKVYYNLKLSTFLTLVLRRAVGMLVGISAIIRYMRYVTTVRYNLSTCGTLVQVCTYKSYLPVVYTGRSVDMRDVYLLYRSVQMTVLYSFCVQRVLI